MHMFSQFYTLEVEPMVTTVTLNYVRRIPALILNLSLHLLCRFAFSPLVYPSGVQKIVFDVIKLTHCTSPAE